MKDIPFSNARPIAQKSYGFLGTIIFLLIIWSGIGTACAFFLKTANGVYIILIAISAVIVLMNVWEAINFFLSPKNPVLTDGEKLYVWSDRKWHEFEREQLDEVRTNGVSARAYTTMRSMMDKGVLRIFDTHGTLFRVRYLADPVQTKLDIEKFISAEQEINTDNTENTVNTDL